MTVSSVSWEQVTQALRDVFDPELGLSVVDLGLIYGVEIDGAGVRITMTLTTQGCPLHDSMTDWIRQAVGKIPGVEDVQVAIVFDPPWTPDRIRPGTSPRPVPSAPRRRPTWDIAALRPHEPTYDGPHTGPASSAASWR